MALELHGIERRFGRQAALAGISLRLERGSCYGFVGHNGAGKTTAMRIALGLIQADSGRVVVDGFDARTAPREVRARLGGLIETPGFHAAWTGIANLEFLARAQGLDARAARAEARRVFERVGLAAGDGKRVGAYSHGMRQRLGIAQALLGSPAYVLLDEPLNGLDPGGIAEMRALLRDLVADGKTGVLVSSHQLLELSEVATTIGVLKDGRMVVEGSRDELLGRGGDRYALRTSSASGASLARQVLERRALVPESARGDEIVFVLGPVAPAAIVRLLVEAGVEISSFAPRPHSLEELYLAVAAADPSVGAASQPALARALPPSAARASTSNAPATSALDPRRAVRRAMRAELTRVLATRTNSLVLLVPALVGLLAMFHRASSGQADEAAVASKELFSTTGVGGFEAFGRALQSGLPVLGIVALGLASQAIASELSRGTLRNLLVRPFRRVELLLGKALALLGLVAGSYFVLAALSFGVAGIAFAFDDVAEILPNGKRFVLTPAADLWPELLRAVVAPIAPLAAYTLLGLAVGTWMRTGTAALAVAFALGAVLDVARAFTDGFGLAGTLPSDHLPSPLSDTSFVRTYVDLSQGLSNASFEHGALGIWVPLAWGLAAIAFAARRLVRKDVA